MASRRVVFRISSAVVLGVLIGAPLGLAGYTFVYARGYSYMTNDPAACNNCHVMREQYDGWIKGSHRAVATCNDCHTPHEPIGKLLTKASNGWHHSVAFTSGEFAEPIRIKAHNLAVTEQACRYCHGDIVQAIDAHASADSGPNPRGCVTCHREVGHAH